MVVLYDANGEQRHVVAIINYQSEKAILDLFERFAMRYSDLLLAVSPGYSVVIGLGEVFKLVPRPGAAVGTSEVVQSEGMYGAGFLSGAVKVDVLSPAGASGGGTVSGSSPAGQSCKRTEVEKRKAKRARKKARKAAAAAASGTGGDDGAVDDVFDDVYEEQQAKVGQLR